VRLKRQGALALAAAVGWAGSACAWDTCRVREPREASADASGATRVRVEAKAGSLLIVGQSDLEEVRASGEACAPDEGSLEKVQLRVERSGEEVLVRVDIPDGPGPRGALDLDIDIPAGAEVDVTDGSGSVEVNDVAGLRLTDGSGSIEVADVSGSVTVERDGSGSIDVQGVEGDVLVRHDGSGSIHVEDVGGDFTVEEDGSGGITHVGVEGRVQIPSR
jgi:hypothetical protein